MYSNENDNTDRQHNKDVLQFNLHHFKFSKMLRCLDAGSIHKILYLSLKPILVSFMLSKLHFCCKKHKFAFHIWSEPRDQKFPRCSSNKQLLHPCIKQRISHFYTILSLISWAKFNDCLGLSRVLLALKSQMIFSTITGLISLK